MPRSLTTSGVPYDKVMLSYYSGYSANGVYNDQSGDAYEILFYPDGTIRVLYIGKFLAGDFHDQTGNAQEIVFDAYNNINKYFYYKGTFTEGDRDGKVSPSNYVTQTEIDEIIAGKEFKIELNWYKTDDTL